MAAVANVTVEIAGYTIKKIHTNVMIPASDSKAFILAIIENKSAHMIGYAMSHLIFP